MKAFVCTLKSTCRCERVKANVYHVSWNIFWKFVLFQIVFILFVCGQGIFIAAFHCLRFPEVWKHWRHLVTTGSTTLPSTVTATGVSTLSSAAEKRHTTEHAANTSIWIVPWMKKGWICSEREITICTIVKRWTHARSHRSAISARSHGNKNQSGLSYRLHYRET